MKGLAYNQKIKIGKRTYSVNSYKGKYFLFHCGHLLNGIIFKDMDISNVSKFVSDIVGYKVKTTDGVSFPHLKSLEDLTKVVNKLQEMVAQKDNIITLEQFREAINKVELCEEWENKLIYELSNDLLLNGSVYVPDSLISDMRSDANTEQLAVLNELFPDDTISVHDLNENEVMEVTEGKYKGDYIKCYWHPTQNIFASLNSDEVWLNDCNLKGKKIKVQITKID